MAKKEDDRVIITRSMIGITAMQVCAVDDATDEEILKVANAKNPSGTTNGWSKVVRSDGDSKKYGSGTDIKPVACTEIPGRKHFILIC